jgi:lipid II:glycine glycyltransferase (peptidoglycan interpeptide bridge formation enzyme)
MMQGYEWGRFKVATGSWKVQRVGVEQNGEIIAGAQLLFRTLPFVPLTIAYLSKGPVVDLSDRQSTTMLWQAIHQAAQAQQAIFLMIEPNFPDNDQFRAHLHQQGFHESHHTNHPHSTIIVNLTPDEDTLMKNMRKKTRQLIRKATRNGIEIIEGDHHNLAEFHHVLQTTAELKDISGHNLEFYQQAWQTYQPINAVKLFIAKHEQQTVAAKMVFRFGNRTMHLWGGTTRQGRALNASYLIQWESIKWAKQQGCHYSDLWGIPDEVGQMLKQGQDVPKDEHDGLWGVYSFKRGFGGEVESYIGTYDYIYKPAIYRALQFFRQFSIDQLSEMLEKFGRQINYRI